VRRRRTLLLTGFEPFGLFRRNVTSEAVSKLGGRERAGVRLRAVVLPVAWPRASRVLQRALDRFRPDAVLAFGIHGKKTGAFRVETVARNELRFRIPDNDGRRYRGRAVVRGGPRTLGVALPASELLGALRRASVPARFSRDAGRFLCNAVYYWLLAKGIPAAFVHVPPRDVGEPARDVLAAVKACAIAWASAPGSNRLRRRIGNHSRSGARHRARE